MENKNNNIQNLSEVEKLYFRQVMQQLNVKPLHNNNNNNKFQNYQNQSSPKVPPYPVFNEKKLYAEQQICKNSINFSLENLDNFDDIEICDYRKNGVQYQVLKQLRRGKFAIQAQIDLHGLNREQALAELSFFLDQCLAVNLRCIKIIHGKGRSHKKSVLKQLTQMFLKNKDEVLAFCYAQPNQGGEGAVIVLLKI